MKKTMINLIPNIENGSPDYYCTWQSQLFACSNTGPQGQRDRMSEHDLFGSENAEKDCKEGIGWATHQYKEARRDLFLIIDDSWDVPYGEKPAESKWYGSLILARDKFPNCYGAESASAFSSIDECQIEEYERAMKTLAGRVTDLGWRGLGGWVCVQKAKAIREKYQGGINDTDYWSEQLMLAERAGWKYWKMDWGEDASNEQLRKTVTDLGHALAPNVWIEHAIVPEVIPFSDTFRSYDAFTLMAIPLTLSRLAQFLMYETQDGYKGLINCEDEPYIAAALGCVLGVMRHGMIGNMPNGEPDTAFPALHRNFKTKQTEVLRTVRWHRLAPAFGVSAKETYVDDARLTDDWTVVSQPEEIEAWWKYKNGDMIKESAPARISRRLPLPKVTPSADGNAPYVISSLNPNGVASIATLGRTHERSYGIPNCDIMQNIGNASTVGIFGEYKTLTLESTAIDNASVVYMQDIASDFAYDITNRCKISEGKLIIPGECIAQIGRSCNGERDTSEPGVVVQIAKEA